MTTLPLTLPPPGVGKDVCADAGEQPTAIAEHKKSAQGASGTNLHFSSLLERW
jgi:hypothetical protein